MKLLEALNTLPIGSMIYSAKFDQKLTISPYLAVGKTLLIRDCDEVCVETALVFAQSEDWIQTNEPLETKQ